MMGVRTITTIVSTLWLLFACGAQHPPAAETGEPRSSSPWPPAFLAATRSALANPLDWIAAEEGEVYPDMDAAWDHPAYLAANDVLTQRLQYWLDTFYQELEAQDPARFHRDAWFIPKPRVRIMKHPSINAFVSSRSVCYRSALTLESIRETRSKQQSLRTVNEQRSAEGNEVNPEFADRHFDGAAAVDPPAEAVMMMNSKGQIGVYRRSQISCLDRSQTPVPVAWVEAYLRQNVQVQSCSFHAADGRLVFDADCSVQGPFPQREPEFIKLESVTPWLTVTTGALAHMNSEEDIVLTLAHELAHYFQAHGSVIKSKFNYFYRQSPAQSQRPRPLPDPTLESLGKELLRLPAFRTQPIEGQRYHSELFAYFRTAMQHLVKPACSAPESPCHRACRDVIALSDETSFQSSLTHFPQAQLKGAARVAYFAYEKLYADCSAAITIDPEGMDSQGLVRPETVKRIYWKAALDPLAPAATLATAVDDMNRHLLQQKAEQEAILQRAIDAELGYYTTEQEADLLALQWLAQIGIDPAMARNYWLRFMAASAEQDSPFNFAYERCLQVYNSQPRWTLAGLPVRPPVGSFAEPHHSKCHRLYQVDQRLNLVNFPLGTDRRPEAEAIGGSWKDLAPKRWDEPRSSIPRS